MLFGGLTLLIFERISFHISEQLKSSMDPVSNLAFDLSQIQESKQFLVNGRWKSVISKFTLVAIILSPFPILITTLRASYLDTFL